MGNGCRRQIHPAADAGSGESSSLMTGKYYVCVQCGLDGHRKVATWWCEDCKNYICNYCAWNHSNMPTTKAHFLVHVDALPKPTKPAWEQKQESKQALLQTYFDTKADLHYVNIKNFNSWNQYDGALIERRPCLPPIGNSSCCPKRKVTEAAAIASGCTFVVGGYIAVADYVNENVKIFDEHFRCNAYVKLGGNKPTDICSYGKDIYVTIEEKSSIYKLQVSLPMLCLGRKLSAANVINTDGVCDSIAICRLSYLSHGLVVGMTFSLVFTTKRYQVHIMDFGGSVKKQLYYDSTGQSLFHGKVYVSGTSKQGEIIVSDRVSGAVYGFNIINRETLFKHKIHEPLGLTVDKDDNIYVITNSCFYWIPAHRETVSSFLKRSHRSKSTNCCYDNKTHTLAVTSSNSETVQLYKII